MGAQRRDRRTLARRDLPDACRRRPVRSKCAARRPTRTTALARGPRRRRRSGAAGAARARRPKRSSIPRLPKPTGRPTRAPRPTSAAGQLALADFYHRRLLPQQEGGRAGRGGACGGSARRSSAAGARAAIVATLRADLRARRCAAAARRVRRSAVPRLDRAISAGGRALRSSVSLPRRSQPHRRCRGAAGRLSAGVPVRRRVGAERARRAGHAPWGDRRRARGVRPGVPAALGRRQRPGILRAARAHPQPPRVSRSGARRHRRAPGRPDAGGPRVLLLPARRKRRRRRTGARRFRGAPRQRDANGGRAVHAGAPVRKNAELQRSAPLPRVDLQPARREPGRRRAGAGQHHRDPVHRAGAAAAVRQRRPLVLPRHRDARSRPGLSERRPVAALQLGLAVEPVRAGAGVGHVVLPSRPRGRPGRAVRDPVPEFTAARRSERHARRHVCGVRRVGRGDRSRTAVPGGVPRRARADRRRAGDGRRVRQEGAGGGGIRRLRPAAPGAGGPGRSGAARRRHRADGGRGRRAAAPAGARSQEYGRVLDRYIARLVSRRPAARRAGRLSARDRAQSGRSRACTRRPRSSSSRTTSRRKSSRSTASPSSSSRIAPGITGWRAGTSVAISRPRSRR